MVGTKKKTPYKLQDRIKFGQYRDKLIKSIVEIEPTYIDWLWAVHECEFTKEVLDAVRVAKQAKTKDNPEEESTKWRKFKERT